MGLVNLLNYGIVIGNIWYGLSDSDGGVVIMAIFDDDVPSLTAGDVIVGYNRNKANFNLQGMSYDGVDTIYFILNKDGDGKNYLCTYSITGDVITDTGIEYDVALMLDRNTIGTANSPWEYEKGFHINSSFIYQINRGYQYLLKLQDIELTGGATIKAITDTKLIISDKSVYSYTESLADLNKAIATYKTHKTPKGRFSHASEFSTDQLIEIYENDSGIYTLVFRGKMGNATYDQRRALYKYAINNMGFDDLKEKVSYVATAEGIDEVVIALFGQLTNPYLYVDATSVPNIAVNMTYTFDDEPLGNALYVCAILGNAFPFFEPNGYSYFRAYSNADPTGWYYGSPDNFNDEVVGTQGTSIAWIDADLTVNNSKFEIIAELDNHKNVMQCYVDNGDTCRGSHTHTAAVSSIYEFWIATSDITKGQVVWFTASGGGLAGGNLVAGLNFDGANDLILIHGNGAGGSASTDLVSPAANNTFYHVKVLINCTTDVISVWLNEVLKVDEEEFFNDQTFTTTDTIVINNSAAGSHSMYMDAWGNVADSKYEVGYNQYDMYSNIIGNMGNPKVNKHQAQFNDFSNVRGGWDETTSKPFAPSDPLIAEHIQQYGKKLWRGRKIFSGAITQASIDAIVAGLKAWQGMVSNPIDASFKIKQYYYPVGYQIGVKFGLNNLIPDITSIIIVGNLTNFKRPNLIDLATSTNIVRRR